MFQLAGKLKQAKKGLKGLHKEGYAHLEDKIEQTRPKLDFMQDDIKSSLSGLELRNKEKLLIVEVKKWLCIKESIMQQKSKVQWINSGYSNSHYFFTSMKEKRNDNSIGVLQSLSGETLTSASDIQKEITGFYHGLLCSIFCT